MTHDEMTRISKSQVNRAGEVLKHSKPGSDEYEAAMDLVNVWRRNHAVPLYAMKAVAKSKTRGTKGLLMAQRLKRLPTIADKLKRHPDMSLSRMQDVGGIRIIVSKVKDAEKLAKKFRGDLKNFSLVREKNYIVEPKLDGYRGIHMIFRFGPQSKDGSEHPCSGLFVELQIRTRIQHTWGTAVESAGILRGEAYKSDKGNEGWLEFFALTSSVMALAEQTPTLVAHKDLSPLELMRAVAKKEKDLGVLTQISGVNVAANYIHANKISADYNLITLDIEKRMLDITGYPKSQLEQATHDLTVVEKRAGKGEKINVVLVSAGRLSSLKSAYPNYFLDLSKFVTAMEKIIDISQEDV